MNFKKCKNCGKAVPEGNYCDQCGAAMVEEVSGPKPSPSIVIKQVRDGDIRVVLRPDTIVGRTQGEYTDQLSGFKYISGRHAHITYSESDGWAVTDLGSTNGTYVNDDCLTKNVPHSFESGDIIDFGTIIFEVE